MFLLDNRIMLEHTLLTNNNKKKKKERKRTKLKSDNNNNNNNNNNNSLLIHFIENQPVNIKIIISIKIFYSINCKNSSTSLFTYIKSKIMVIVTISIRK